MRLEIYSCRVKLKKRQKDKRKKESEVNKKAPEVKCQFGSIEL